jgi:hypothetical protein
MDLSPSFITLLLIRGDELRVLGSPTECLPAKRLTVGEFYLLYLTSRGDMQQLYADVQAMDLGHWPADGTALVTKVGRTLDKLKSTVESKRILRASDEDFRAWSDQPLSDKYVSVRVRAKLRRLKCSGVGSREATNVNSTLGGTSTAAGDADALAFGGSDAADGDAADGINFEQLASGESRSLNYCSNILSVITETPFVSARCYLPPW